MPKTKAFFGIPIPYKGFHIKVPLMKDVLEDSFWVYLKALTISQDELDDDLKLQSEEDSITPLQYIILRSLTDEDFKDMIEKAFKFFLDEEIFISAKNMEIILGSPSLSLIEKQEMAATLNEENFLEFQNLIRVACGREVYEEIDPTLPPRAKAMIKKARYRDRVKAKQNSKRTSLISSISSLCVLGIGITPFNMADLSYSAFQELLNRSQKKQNYDIDIAILTNPYAGGKREITDWME